MSFKSWFKKWKGVNIADVRWEWVTMSEHVFGQEKWLKTHDFIFSLAKKCNAWSCTYSYCGPLFLRGESCGFSNVKVCVCVRVCVHCMCVSASDSDSLNCLNSTIPSTCDLVFHLFDIILYYSSHVRCHVNVCVCVCLFLRLCLCHVGQLVLFSCILTAAGWVVW